MSARPTEACSVQGTVPEADQAEMTFEVELPDGRRLKAPIAAQHYAPVMAAFGGYRSGAHVRLEGVGRFDARGRLVGFESIEHVSVLDARDIPARLQELGALQDGWLEGRGQAPPQGGLAWLARAFGEHYPDELPRPYLYPTEAGGVQAEWTFGSEEITLEIDLGTHAGHWHRLNLQTDAEEARPLTLDDETGWSWLVGEIQTRSRGA